MRFKSDRDLVRTLRSQRLSKIQAGSLSSAPVGRGDEPVDSSIWRLRLINSTVVKPEWEGLASRAIDYRPERQRQSA